MGNYLGEQMKYRGFKYIDKIINYDAEEDKLKLEWWLFHLMDGRSPIEVLWEEMNRSVPL